MKSESISRGLKKPDPAYGIVRHLGFTFTTMQWKGIEELEEEADVSWVTSVMWRLDWFEKVAEA